MGETKGDAERHPVRFGPMSLIRGHGGPIPHARTQIPWAQRYMLGAPFDGICGFTDCVGAAWLFTRSGGHWSEAQKLVPEDPSGGGAFGNSVALSGDGNAALIGAPLGEGLRGVVWAYSGDAGSWADGELLTPATETPGLGPNPAPTSAGRSGCRRMARRR